MLAEDSDILTYGCNILLTKFDMRSGELQEVNLTWAFGASEETVENFGEIGRLKQWTLSKFQDLCVFAGCDYGGAVEGVGLKTAWKLLLKSCSGGVGVLRNLPKLGDVKEATRKFLAAKFVFQYAWVFNDENGRCMRLEEVPADLDEAIVTKSTGEAIQAEICPEVMTGELDVKTGLRRTLVKFTPAESRTMEIFSAEKENLERTRLRAIATHVDKVFDKQISDHKQLPTHIDPLLDMRNIQRTMGLMKDSSEIGNGWSDMKLSDDHNEVIDDLMDLAEMFDDAPSSPPPTASTHTKTVVNPFAKKTVAVDFRHPQSTADLDREPQRKFRKIEGAPIARIFDKSTWTAPPKDERPHILTTVPKAASVAIPNSLRSLINRKAKF